MHEEQHRLVALRQPLGQPLCTLFAQHAVAHAGFVGVEEDAAVTADGHLVLHEAVGVHRHLREVRAKALAAVVVAQDGKHRHGQAAELLRELAVGVRVAGVGQVAGDNTQRGIAMLCDHAVDAAGQAAVRVEPVECLPLRHQVRVGDVDELEHDAVSPLQRGSRACTSRVMVASALSGATSLATTVWMWSLMTSVIFRPLSPGKAYQPVSTGSCLMAVR